VTVPPCDSIVEPSAPRESCAWDRAVEAPAREMRGVRLSEAFAPGAPVPPRIRPLTEVTAPLPARAVPSGRACAYWLAAPRVSTPLLPIAELPSSCPTICCRMAPVSGWLATG